ncbi:MAG: DUF58 domain-containing protein [Gammaproteobacteria bacterium]|nr:MAG: DUF58 domain-containing protein [Gammaproteobacteria bacterium]RLA11958.1 MAG: DUF58 domain-containing protein [Gammaproteobacteria bacterium]
MSQAAPVLPASARVEIQPATLFALQHAARSLSLRAGNISAARGGSHLSKFRGRGMEYEESRRYLPGDDIRSIDWRVTARSGTTHTKLYRDERERPVLTWLDYRASMFFATVGSFKSVLAAQSMALLAWTAQNNGDRVGGMIFNDTDHHEYRPRRGRQSMLAMLQSAGEQSRWRPETHPASINRVDTDTLEAALHRLQRLARPGSLLFLVSDFRGLTFHPNNPAKKLLARLADHNELLLHQIYDPLEQALPDNGRYPISDGLRQFMLQPSPSTQQRYREEFLGRQQALQSLSQRRNVGLITQTTADDLLAVLQRALPARRQ